MILTIAPAYGFDQPLLNAKEERRAQGLFEQIRCPSCEGQSIKDSNTEVSKLMREEIRKQITSGKTDEQIIQTMTTYYGEQISLSPSGTHANILLLMPLSFLMLGIFFIISKSRFKGIR